MLEQIKFTYEESENQENLFTPQHTKFACVIKYNGKQYTFDYQCNVRYCEPTKESCMACLLQDSKSLEWNNLESWLCEYGYNQDTETMRKGIKIYKACERTKKALYRMFNSIELSELWNDCLDEM